MAVRTVLGAWLAAMAAAAFLLASIVPWMTVAAGGAEMHEIAAAVGLTGAGLIWVFVSAFYFRRRNPPHD
jgi:Na+/melibiose symporter-like transporter